MDLLFYPAGGQNQRPNRQLAAQANSTKPHVYHRRNLCNTVCMHFEIFDTGLMLRNPVSRGPEGVGR